MTRTARVVRASDHRSLEAFAAQTPYRYAEFFQANNAAWVDDEVLRSLHKVMPRLRAVDLSHVGTLEGTNITSKGVKAILESSTSLRVYHQYSGVMSSICSAIAAASVLTTLSLRIDESIVIDSLSPLEDHPTLKHLSLRFDAYTAPELPECLPKLETLSIAVGPYTDFNWDSVLPFCPSLKALTIDDRCGDELYDPAVFGALTPRTLHQLLAELPSLQACHVARVASVVFYACTTCHDDERIICYRAPPGVSLTFGPAAFPPGFRVVLDVDTAPLPLAVAVWDYETITDLDATAVPLGYV